jgi:FecR-like protein
MKKFLTKTFNSKPITVCGILFILIAPDRLANADPLKEAHVSQIIQDVRLLEAHAAPHPAALNDKVALGSAVRTGVESRAELTFNDLTITRLGANTIFSFTAGARQAELTQGAILLQVKPGAPAVRANTTAVTVAVMGGTALLSTGPPTKFMVLEGIGTIYPLGHPEKAVTVHGGEMVTAEGGRISKPEKFDVNLVLATSALILDFPPLANLPLILAVVNQQQAEQQLMVSNPPPYKSMIDTIDVTSQNADANPAVIEVRLGTPTPSPTEPPPPPPSKFGTPSTITSPNPYLITSGTTITTDPSITTNGVTDFGKIYRGSTDDGPFTLWAFGSTSAFDTALNLDTEFFADPSHLPIAAFKFQSLSLTGNPTIDLSNGGVTKLALIGVDGITSGPPGGTLTFTGLDLLVLATVNGSINLTSDVSFQNLNELAMYARGTGSNLILNSPISNIGILKLAAEGSIQLTNPGTMSVGDFETTAGNNLTLQIGGSLLLDGRVRLKTLVLPGTTVANGANVTVNIAGDYTNSSATEFSLLHVRNDGAHIGTGGNIGVNIGGDLTAMSDFDLVVQNTNGQIDNGGNITVMTNGSISTGGEFSLLVENYDDTGNPAGHIGTGGNISVTTGGGLTANSILAFVNNRNGGTIDSGGNMTFNIGGALTTQGDAVFVISNRNDGSGGGTVGSNVLVSLNAESVSVGGFFDVVISTNGGGHILGDAINTVDVAGDLTAQQGILVDIEDTIFGGTGNFTGGRIDGNAIITLSAQNITTPSTASGIPGIDLMAIEASIYPNTSGTVGGDAIVNVLASQNISAPGSVLFWIANGNYQNLGGGMIGGNAEVNVSASNISTGDLFTQILNYGSASIGGNAMISVNANTMSVGGNLDALIDNTGGTIGGSATINMNVSSSATVTNDATVAIYGSDGAVGGAAININGGSYNVGGTFLSYIDGNGTITFNNATAHADVLKAGVFGANGALNIGGGILSADSELKLYASGSNGTLNFLSNVTLGGNAVKILAANTINILDGVVVTIGGATPAEVYTTNANYTGFGGNGTTTGTFAGAGANNPLPLNQAPPFGAPPPSPARRDRDTINVSNTAELLALLDGAVVGPDGRITISGSSTRSNLRDLSRINMNGLPRGVRRMLMQQVRDRDAARVGGRRIL